jgi:trigger factor
MQTELIEQKDAHAKFSVQVPAADVDKTFSKTLQALSRQAKVPGFRPGKAPRGVLEAKVGKETLAGEVRDTLVNTYCPQAIRELELKAINLDVRVKNDPAPGEAYSFEVEADLFPEITLPDVAEIVIDSEIPPLTEEIYQEALDRLRDDNATLVPVERPVQAGDYVVLTDKGGENSLPIDMERAGEEIAGQLLGKAIGDNLELTFTHEDEGEDEALEDAEHEDGEEVQAEDTAPASHTHTLGVTVADIREKDTPEVDDDFAKTLGFDTWAEAETRIRENLQVQLEQEGFEEQQEEFIDKLTAECDFPLPASLVTRRKAALLKNIGADLERRGLELSVFLESLEAKGESQSFEDNLDSRARDEVKRDLVLQTLLEESGMKLSDAEFNEALNYLAASERTDIGHFKRELGEEGLENYRFLLARDKAVRETVKKLTGEEQEEEPADIRARAAKSGLIVP